jgi:hypothetical protein
MGIQESTGDNNRALLRKPREAGRKAAIFMTNERKNITQPADWWAAFGGEATKRGLTLSEFIGLAASKMLTRDQRKELSERIKPGRKKNEDLD